MARSTPSLSVAALFAAFAVGPACGAPVLISGCSNGWFHTTPRASQDTPDDHERRAAAPAARGRASSSSTASNPPQPLASTADVTPAKALDPARPRPVLNAELDRLRRSAEEDVLGNQSPPGPHALGYAPFEQALAGSTEVLGHFVPVENESALEHFHMALARLAAGKDDDAKVRIVAYGGSHTQADTYTDYLRAYLQRRFGDGGQGFVLLGRVNKWYRTSDTRVQHRGLSVQHARSRLVVQDEPLGLFGAALVGRRAGSFGEIITSEESPNTRFEVHYYRQPRGGGFSIQLDGKTIARIQTQSDKPSAGYHAFEAAPGRHRIRARLHGNGRVRLFGVIAETAAPGIVVDTLGIGGARIASSLRWDEATWIEALRHRKPDLVTFAYGTNEVAGEAHSQAAYERDLRAVLARLRKGLPEISCLLIAPFDFPARGQPRSVTHPQLGKVLEAQRRISKELGCGFWDGYAFMGGQGAMHRWVMAKPPLASPDHIHLTRRGYVYAGIAIGDALMRRYDLNAEPSRGPIDLATPSASGP